MANSLLTVEEITKACLEILNDNLRMSGFGYKPTPLELEMIALLREAADDLAWQIQNRKLAA